MKNVKLGTKVIGMVIFILVLMVMSAGFGILKMNIVGNELQAVAEEDIPLTGVITEINVNQLEQAIWFERALRYGEVLAEKDLAVKGLKHAEEAFEKHNKVVNEALKKGEKLAEHAARSARPTKRAWSFKKSMKS